MFATRAARSLCLVVLGLSAPKAVAQNTTCHTPEFLNRADIPGFGLAEVNQYRVDTSTHGFAEFPTACVTDETIFEAASLTKPVVAYVVMRLVDQGRVGLDDVLVERLPTLPLPGDDPRSKGVTIRMALAHSTGLSGPDNAELSFIADPGTTFEYYPAGYRLVQRVIEDLEGASLEDIARREVFEPLDMNSSSLVFREDLLNRIATRHRMLGDAFERARDPQRPANAAASLITTPGDYGKFLRAMLKGDHLSAPSRRTMLTPQIIVPDTDGKVGWGLGWGIEIDRGTFFHWGDDGAAKCFTMGSTEQQGAFVYFANSYYGMAIAREMAASRFPGDQPAVDWLGYGNWNSPKRLARLDTVRAFVEGDPIAGMDTFKQYQSQHPELDMDNIASFVTWVLQGREVHDGRARLLRWQIERQPEKVDLYLNLAESLKAVGDLESAITSLRNARPHADDSTAPFIEAQLAWMDDDIEAKQSAGRTPDHETTALIGRYDTWRIFAEAERLRFQPGEGNRYTLRWMHGATYALEEIEWFRLRFVLEDDKATKLIGMYSDGRADESDRAD
ncbi:MAG: serine hydrolase domain-containing protein [Planctomycetota bacterium]